MVKHLAGWIRAWRTMPFLFRRSSAGRWLARVASVFHFRSGRVTYLQRERFNAARLASQSVWNLIRLAVVPLLSAALAVIILGIGPFVYGRLAPRFGLPLFIRFPPVDPQSFNGVVGTIAQAAAAVLALFFAAISVVASTAYVRVTTEVRALIANDPLNRRYLRVLAHVTAASLGAGAMQAAGYVPSAALLWYLLALAGICMAAFLPLGIRTFALFDPAFLAWYPTVPFFRALRAAGESGHRWLDPSFQNHANRTASTQLGLLEDLLEFAIADNRPRNDTVVALIRQSLIVGASYTTRKHSIPSDSLWFPKKAEFRRWEVTDSSMTEIALQAGVTPAPEHVPDHVFVESRISGMLKQGVEYLLGKNALNDLASVLLDAGKVSTSYAKHFGQSEAMECVAMLRNVLLERLKGTESTVEPLKYLGVIDLLGFCALAPILYTPLAVTEQAMGDALALSTPLLNLERRAVYRSPRPRKVLQSAEDLLKRLEFEKAVERRVCTKEWYVRQILALAYADYVRDVISNVVLTVEREFVVPPTQLVSAKRSLWAAVWLQRSIEACNKARDRIHSLHRRYEELRGCQVAEFEWQPSGADAALAKIEEHRVAIVRLLATIVPDLVKIPTGQDLPDILGVARARIADELLSMMDRKEAAAFAEFFRAYFTASLATYDHFVKLMATSGGEHYVYVAMNILLEVMDLSGLALLFSELDGTSFAADVRATWDPFLSNRAEASKVIAALYAAIDTQLAGPMLSPSAMRRQAWGRQFALALQNRGVDMERDFYSRSRPRHSSPIIDSLNVFYGHPMDEVHEYFAALYLSVRPEAKGLTLPRVVKDCLESVERARQRTENGNDDSASETDNA